jgi:cell division protein FtsN
VRDTQATVSETGGVAIQIGAFRELSSARSVKLQLERAGFSGIRLVRVPDNALIRVRMGKYPNRNAAAPMIVRLRQKSFTAVVVTDVAREVSAN